MDEFETFWKAYPRRTAKGAARKSWERAAKSTPGLLEKCLEALAWQKEQAQWTRDGGAYVPHPSTYLNQERWDDEPPQADAFTVEERRHFALWQQQHGEAAKDTTLGEFVAYTRGRRRV